MNIENLRWLYRIGSSTLKANLEEVTPEEALRRPEPGGNSVAWVVGHLLRSRQFLLTLLGTPWSIGEAAEIAYKRGSTGDDDGAFLPFERILKLWDESQELLMKALDNLTEEALQGDAPPLGDFARADTLERRILFLYFHETYHLGQLGLIRRLLGKEGAIK